MSFPDQDPKDQDYIYHNATRRLLAITSFSVALTNPSFSRGVVAGCPRDFCCTLLPGYSCRETSCSSAAPFTVA